MKNNVLYYAKLYHTDKSIRPDDYSIILFDDKADRDYWVSQDYDEFGSESSLREAIGYREARVTRPGTGEYPSYYWFDELDDDFAQPMTYDELFGC